MSLFTSATNLGEEGYHATGRNSKIRATTQIIREKPDRITRTRPSRRYDGLGDGIEKHVIPAKTGIQVRLGVIISKVAFSQLLKLSSYRKKRIQAIYDLNPLIFSGAEGGTRTPTRFPSPPPQDGVSTSSTTSALYLLEITAFRSVIAELRWEIPRGSKFVPQCCPERRELAANQPGSQGSRTLRRCAGRSYR